MGDQSFNTTILFTPLISVKTRIIVEVVNYVILAQSISLFGIVVNLINILVFAKQGFQDAANVSLMGLAVGDLGSLLTTLLLGIWLNPLLENSDTIHFFPKEIAYLTAGMPHLYFTRVTSWITAFITIERCVCITKPLKVKQIFTLKRAVAVILVIYLYVMLSVTPVYYSTQLGWKWFPQQNRSFLSLIFREDRMDIDSTTVTINGMVLPLASFFIVSICTIILAVKMRSKMKWREAATRSAAKGGDVSTRDMKVIRMVTFIALIFIISSFPSVVMLLALQLEPGLSVGGRYMDIYNMVFSICYVPETINSSINIFIYMRMSTRFKTTFDNLFRRGRKAKAEGCGQ